jgi:peptidyl-dipeptidase A
MHRVRTLTVALTLTILPLPLIQAAPQTAASSPTDSTGPRVSSAQERANQFLALVNSTYQALYKVNSEAQWKAVTDVTPAHDAASEVAGKAYAAFDGNPAVIREAQDLLKRRAELDPLTVRELNQVLLNAGEGPMTNPSLVARRIQAETRQASFLNSFQFKLDGKPITANEIDNRLSSSNDLVKRKAAWERRKKSGRPCART